MEICLPNSVCGHVSLSFEDPAGIITVRFSGNGMHGDTYRLKSDLYPDIRYLLVLYFHDERINTDKPGAHAITLQEYIELYEAMFGIHCAYTDKNKSIDHFRSDELYNRVLKGFGLRFAKGGLCEFRQGTPDPAARARFRSELLEEFRLHVQSISSADPFRQEWLHRYRALKSYTSIAPSRYMGCSPLEAQQLEIGGSIFYLYSASHAVSWPEVIRRYPRIHLQGEGGSGKTTFLRVLALDPDVNSSFRIEYRSLAVCGHLYTRSLLTEMESHPEHDYLFLLDGYNEISRDGSVRTSIKAELDTLVLFPNVYLIVSARSSSGIWPGYTSALMRDLTPGPGMEPDEYRYLDNPLLFNTYCAIPKGFRGGLSSTFAILDFRARVQLASALQKCSSPDEVMLYTVAYSALLPYIGDRICIEDSFSFDESIKNSILSEFTDQSSELYAFARNIFLEAGEDMPDLAGIPDQTLERIFSLLVDNGDIVRIKNRYMFSHQMKRDYYAASCELKKLQFMLSDQPDKHIHFHCNLPMSATSLLREALRIQSKNETPDLEYVRQTVLDRIRPVRHPEDIDISDINIANAAAQIYEFVVPYRIKFLIDDRFFPEAFRRITDCMIEEPEETDHIISAMEDPGHVRDMLAFLLSKQTEIHISGITRRADPLRRIADCIHTVDAGMKIVYTSSRLLNAKAKALLYRSQFLYSDGNIPEAGVALEASLSLLRECHKQGNFLSGNMLAFALRVPVPYVLDLKPDIRNCVEGFTVNFNTATDPSLKGLNPTYARMQAIDALFLGEVRIGSFTGLASFKRLTSLPDGRAKAVRPGTGSCGPKEIALARALMFERGDAINDTLELAVFFHFLLNWYAQEKDPHDPDILRTLREQYNPYLKSAIKALDEDYLLEYLTLYYLNEGMADDMDFELPLHTLLQQLIDKLEDYLQDKRKTARADNNHPYYICRRFLHYMALFSGAKEKCVKCKGRSAACGRCGPFRKEVTTILSLLDRFEKTYPGLKL